MALEWPSWRVIEQAEEELQILEAQHPNRFDYLKLELKSFIFVESQKLLLHSNTSSSSSQSPRHNTLSTSSTASTQGSTTRKRKKGGSEIREIMEGNIEKASIPKFQRVDGYPKRRDGVDVVLERAEACLQKIRDLKANFF